MSDEQYRGDSPLKKAARAYFWQRVAVEIGDWFDHRDLKFLVLCSREGGDISTLKALGVNPSRVVAVDVDANALDQAASKFPTATFFHGDVKEAAFAYRGQCCAAFLDFCGPVGVRMTEAVFRVATRALVRGGVIGFGAMRGREKADGKAMIRTAEEIEADSFDLEVRNKNDEIIKRAMASNRIINTTTQGKEPPPIERATALWLKVAHKARSFEWEPAPLGGFTYHSRGVGNCGVPMMYSLARKASVGWTHQVKPDVLQAFFERRAWVDLNAAPGLTEEETLRQEVLNCYAANSLEYTSLLFNVPSSTIVAWKAVANRKPNTFPFQAPANVQTMMRKLLHGT